MNLRMTTTTAMVSLGLMAGPAFADMEAAKSFLDSEIDGVTTLSRADQEAEMQWFVDAAQPFCIRSPFAVAGLAVCEAHFFTARYHAHVHRRGNGHACVLVATAKDSGGCRLCWRSACVLGTMGGAWEHQEAALGACRASETHEQRPSPAAAQLGWQLEPRISNIMIHYSRAHQTPTQHTGGWCDHTHEVWWPNSQRSLRNHDRRVSEGRSGD